VALEKIIFSASEQPHQNKTSKTNELNK